jgi:halocyanin-like protein
MRNHSRREALAATGAFAAAGLAGCVDAIVPGGGEEAGSEPEDRTGEETVTVAVGADGGFAFAPATVVVDTGTEVRWEWTGAGGVHNVIDRGGAFESGLTAEAGHVFAHAFDEPGRFEYVCTPHQTRGMVGTVDVVE